MPSTDSPDELERVSNTPSMPEDNENGETVSSRAEESVEDGPWEDAGDRPPPGSSELQLVFRDITVVIDHKDILREVSGMACAGELLAIMGSSGGGKTTLLNALAGRQVLNGGEITLNGTVINKSLKRKISYVLQEDVFFPNLTLKETLAFATMIRLPDWMPQTEKMSRMEDVIDTLDIRKCLDTKIGDTWLRGLSGGEKKRASIACELITDPNLIYMDEPTSGLDYSTALSLVSTLKNVATQFNKTVIITIHQPSSKIFFLFDKLLLLCDGQVAYYGKAHEVIDTFDSLGMHIDAFMNPADFIVDKLKEGEEVKQRILTASKLARTKDSWPVPLRQPSAAVNSRNKSNSLEHGSNSGNNHNATVGFLGKMKQNLPRLRGKRPQSTDEEADGSVRMSLMDLNRDELFADDSKWPTGFWTQYSQLTMRTFRQSKSRILDKLKIAESICLCALVSLIWFQLPRTEETLRDRMGVVFYIAIHWGFTPLFDAVSSFPLERVIIHKERSSGWYRLSAYYLAKMTSELPLIILQPVGFVIISYWCIGLNGVGPFFATIFVVIMDAIAGQSIGLVVGIACMDFRRAMVVATVAMMAIMLLGGFYTRNLPVWLDWIKYLSFLHYSFHSLLYLEFSGADPIKCAKEINSTHFPLCSETNVTHIPTEEVLSYYEIDWSFAGYFLPLLLIIFVLRIVGYICLRFLHRPTSV